MSKAEIYLTAIYWSIYTVTTVGYGDIQPKNSEEIGVCMIWNFLGVFLWSYILANMTAILT